MTRRSDFRIGESRVLYVDSEPAASKSLRDAITPGL